MRSMVLLMMMVNDDGHGDDEKDSVNDDGVDVSWVVMVDNCLTKWLGE